MKSISTIDVLGIPLFDGSIADATEHLIDTVQAGEKRNLCISATGAHGMVSSRRDAVLRKALKEFHLNLPDGMPGVWIGKIKGAKNIARCYGPEFIRNVMIATKDKDIRHFFCGGAEGVAAQLKEACERNFGNKNVVGVFTPPFREMTESELAYLCAEIERQNTDVLWIGISTPKQEKFAYTIAKRCKVHFVVTVGAAFDFHIGKVKQAPKFVQNMGLEWFFRLCMEPARLWRRYVNIVPLFLYYNLLEFIGFNKKRELT